MTWTKQIAHFQRLVGRDTDDTHAERVARKRALHERGSWTAIQHIVADALRGFIGFGPDYARHSVGPINAFIPEGVTAFLATVEGEGPLSAMTFEVLDSTNFFELLGYPIPSEVMASLATLVSRIETNRKGDPDWHWQRGFIALALKQDPVWRGIAGLMPGPLSFAIGETFGPNVQGLMSYLAAALQHQARIEDVMPAWKTFLAIVPGLFNADQVNFQTLFWVARIVYHDIAGRTLGEAGDQLYADIQEVAAAGL